MGVPKFFAWLNRIYKEYCGKNIVINNISKEKKQNAPDIDIFYLDANSMIHNSCNKWLKHNKNAQIQDIELAVINGFIMDFDQLIKLVKPKHLIYVAIDGVIPLSKICHQWCRRHSVQFLKTFEHNFNTYFGLKSNSTAWTSSNITPGTKFMELLDKLFVEYINKKKQTDGVSIIYSSSNVRGEGEQKIMEHIRKMTNHQDKKLVYGLDADLIHLCMITHQKNILLLRENMIIDETNSYDIVSIDDVYNMIITLMKSNVIINKFPEFVFKDILNIEMKNEDIINDFVFICYFLGNDFIPQSYCLNLKTLLKYNKNNRIYFNGIDVAIFCYKMAKNKFPKENLISVQPFKINANLFIEFIKILKNIEPEIIKDIHSIESVKYDKLSKTSEINSAILNFSDPITYDILGIKTFETNLLIAEELQKNSGDDFDKFSKIYNECYFGKITDISLRHYIENLYWCGYYYFDYCPDWLHHYEEKHAPLFVDLYNYLKKNSTIIEQLNQDYWNKTIDTHKFLINPTDQLAIVLPKQMNYLLPKELKQIMDLHENQIYSNKIVIDMINKQQLYMCLPICNINPIKILYYAKKYIKKENNETDYKMKIKI